MKPVSNPIADSNATDRVRVVAIDGPGGVGKSTVAREVALRLGFRHLDTGAMYRAVTWLALQKKADFHDEKALGALAASCTIRLAESQGGDVRVWCNDVEITSAIREREVSVRVSDVADCEPVRDALVARQREMGLEQPSVLEGRDITTVVFPDARWKFFLEADVCTRAERRRLQVAEAGKKVSPEQVFHDIAERDFRDRTRPKGALRVAPNATILDTTHMNRDQVVDLLVTLVKTDLDKD